MDENESVQRKKKKKRNIAILIAAVIVIAAAAGTAAWIRTGRAKQEQAESLYTQAVSLVFEGSYEEAEELFFSIPVRDYKEVWEYLTLCDVLRYYDAGEIESADAWMETVELTGLTEEQEQFLADLRITLRSEHDAYLEELFRIRDGIPFVGMPESEIKNTTLGLPSGQAEVRFVSIDGKPYEERTYTFMQSGITIFTARCVRGEVTEVCDLRDTIKKPAPPKFPSHDRDGDPYEDPYSVNEYGSEDEFYEENRDEFFDYWEAEDYFYEHHE